MTLALLALLAACTGGVQVRDYGGFVPCTTPPDVYAAMVVDADTGRPLPGATLRLFREEFRPEAMPGPLVFEARADDHGVVSFPWTEDYASCHFVFDHPGYAPYDMLGPAEELIDLEPGMDIATTLLLADGTPAAGVEVEAFLGCPHSPAVRRAVTDAQGRFVLPDLTEACVLWALAPGGVAEELNPRREPVPGHVFAPIRLEPGVVVTGTAFDGAGRPAAGAVVYSTHYPRGPRDLTGPDGRFRLVGVPANAEIAFGPPAKGLEIQRTPAPQPVAPPGGEEHLIRIRPPGGTDGFSCFWIEEYADFVPLTQEPVRVKTRRTGPVVVQFEHDVYGMGSIVVDVDRPVIEVGPEAFPKPGAVVVVHPDGRPALGWSIGDEDAWAVAGWNHQPGARVLVHAEDHLACRRVLEGESPFVLRLSACTLEIELEKGMPFCWLDGQGCGSYHLWDERVGAFDDPDERTLTIRGVDPGPHTLLVGAQGFRGKVVRLTLREGETRRVRLALDPAR